MNTSNSEQKSKQAAALLQAGDISKASALLDEILQHDKNHLASWLIKARLELQHGNKDVAADAFKQALKLSPDCEDAIINLSGYYGAKQNFEQANQLLCDAITASPTAARYPFMLGNLLLQNGYHTKAIHNYKLATKLAPDNLQIYVTLAEAQGKHGNYDAALETLRPLIEAEPPMFSAVMVFANISVPLNMNEDCKTLLDKLSHSTLTPEQSAQLQATQQMLLKAI